MPGIATNRWPWNSEAQRPTDEKTLDTFLEEAAAAGYDAIEYAEEGIAERAAAHGLRVCGHYAGGPLHVPWEDIDAEARFLQPARLAAEAGADYMVVNADPRGSWSARERKTDDELKRQGENLSRLAEMVAAMGLSLLLHNHADQRDLHDDDLGSVLEFADPAVGLCLDTGWALTAGDDPIECACRMGERLRGLHLRNQRGKRPTEWLGEGDIDVEQFVAALREIGYSGWWTTELWHRKDVSVTGTLLQAQQRTVSLLRALTGTDS